jgi:hypothetical protein
VAAWSEMSTEMHDENGPVAATMSLGPSRNWGSTTNDGAVPEAGVLGRSAEVRSAVVGSDVGVPSIGGHAWAGQIGSAAHGGRGTVCRRDGRPKQPGRRGFALLGAARALPAVRRRFAQLCRRSSTQTSLAGSSRCKLGEVLLEHEPVADVGPAQGSRHGSDAAHPRNRVLHPDRTGSEDGATTCVREIPGTRSCGVGGGGSDAGRRPGWC